MKLWVLILFIALVSLIKCLGLEETPQGFFADESAIAAQVVCVGENGVDILGRSWPLFSQVLAGGYITPVTLYGGVLWSKVFGISIWAFRLYAVFWSLLTVLGIGLAVWFWSKNKGAALFAASLASISPWLFPLSRVFWDPIVACGLFSLGLAALAFAMRSDIKKPSLATRWYLFGLLMGLAALSYPTIRIQVPIIFVMLFIVERWMPGWRNPNLRRGIFYSGFIFALVCLPMLRYYMDPWFLARGKMLAVWNQEFLQSVKAESWQIPWIVLKNMWSHFSLSYLVWNGDTNLRHSTGAWGMWSPVEVFGLVLIFWPGRLRRSPWRGVLWILIGIYISGIFATSLTWESIPHALRSFSSMPALAAFMGLWVWLQWRERPFYGLYQWLLIFVLIGFSGYYLRDYFTRFHETSAIYFDRDIVKQAQTRGASSLPKDYPDMSRAYFLYREGQACHPRENFKP